MNTPQPAVNQSALAQTNGLTTTPAIQGRGIDFAESAGQIRPMLNTWFTKTGFLWILMMGLALTPRCQAQSPTTTTISCIVIEGSNNDANGGALACNLFVYVTFVRNGTDPTATNGYPGPLRAVRNRGTNVPFSADVQDGDLLEIYQVRFFPAMASVGEAFTLLFENSATNLFVALDPVFLAQPQSQSLLAGSNASLTANPHFSPIYS